MSCTRSKIYSQLFTVVALPRLASPRLWPCLMLLHNARVQAKFKLKLIAGRCAAGCVTCAANSLCNLNTDTHTHTHTGEHTHTHPVRHSDFKQLFMARSLCCSPNPNSTKSTNSETLFSNSVFQFEVEVAADVRLQLQLPTDCAAVCLWRFLAACCAALLTADLLCLTASLLVPPPRVVNSMWKLKLTTTDVGHAAEGSQQAAESSRQAAAAATATAAAAAGSKQCCQRQLQLRRLCCCCCGERKLLQF